jgi:hypothetical protein
MSTAAAAHLRTGYHWLHDLLAAAAGFEQALISQTTAQTRAELERMLILSLAGELSGLSLVPPDLTLRLLPHFVPLVYQWRRMEQNLDDLTGSLQSGC